MKHASKVHKPFQYTPASASMKPGYLARKFAAIAKRQAEAKKTKVVQ